ncbi:SH3 domain-containing protein [Roseibium litorale]|uniref:SH3 domain-containing protein n=1 Tax=Roseibium litorale TaxID=2803841 RepID=A0ABR9CRC4_9HYPH|nr:SH3 domain-containing protein [Roseibium litorale]MBD8893432.1 SH3 domain-containing protein [Roseibium litorale]
MYQTLDASKPMPARRPSGPVTWGPQSPAAPAFARRPFGSASAQGGAPKRPRILWTEDGSDLELPDLLAAGPALGAPFSRPSLFPDSPVSPPSEEAAAIDVDLEVDSDAAAAPKASTPAKGFVPFPRPAFLMSVAHKRVAVIAAGVSLATLTGFLLLPSSSSRTGDRMVTTGAIHVQPQMQDGTAAAKAQVAGTRFAESFSEAERERNGALAQKIQDRLPTVLANQAKDPMASLVSQTAETGQPVRTAGLYGEQMVLSPGSAAEDDLTLSTSLAQSPEAHGTSFLQEAAVVPEAEAAAGLSPAATRLKLGGTPLEGSANASVNLREGADMGTNVIGVVPAGAKLSVGECDTWWCAVSHDGKTGYIGRKFIDTAAAQAG